MSIPRLSRFGLSAKDVAPMVELAKKASSMRYNPVALGDDVLAGILEKAL
jgi:alcohol dehydrogenase class IV